MVKRLNEVACEILAHQEHFRERHLHDWYVATNWGVGGVLVAFRGKVVAHIVPDDSGGWRLLPNDMVTCREVGIKPMRLAKAVQDLAEAVGIETTVYIRGNILCARH